MNKKLDGSAGASAAYDGGSRRVVFAAAVLVLAVFGIEGCAYRFAANGSALPTSAKTIYVERFINNTHVPGVNDEFMRYVKNAISSHGRLTVVDDPSEADLSLKGWIIFAGTSVMASSGVLEPLQYRDTLTVAAALTDLRSQQVLWSTRGISGNAEAAAVPQAIVATTPQFLRQDLRGRDLLKMSDIQVGETQQAAAQDQMMAQLASELYTDMAWGL